MVKVENYYQNFCMSDIGDKIPTKRTAIAQGRISVNRETFKLIKEKKLKKGDALVLAEIAGIQSAKNASNTILLCHPIIIDHIKVSTELEEETSSILTYALVSTVAKTGVEMEAIAAVNGALITIYDLAKMYDPEPEIYDIRLLFKSGGKKGIWTNSKGIPSWIRDEFIKNVLLLDGKKAAVITISDRASDGIYEDKSGKLLSEILTGAGAKIINYKLVKDEQDLIAAAISDLVKERPHLIITTGGTGLSGRDVTPEAFDSICTRLIPGIGEYLRINGAQYTKHSWSSRSKAGVIDQTLIITLPGNPKAVNESLNCLLPILPHLIQTIAGEKHD